MADDEQVLDQGEEVSNEAESDTAAESSVSDETAQDSEDTGSASESEESEDQSVPYSRFREVNQRMKEAENKLKELESNQQQRSENTDPQAEVIRQQLKEMGFVSKDEVEETLKRQREDDALRQELDRLEGKLDGKDGRPKFDRDKVVKYALDKQIGDLETAYEKLNQKAIIDWHVKNALDKSKGVKAEASDGSGSGEAGPSNTDLLEAYRSGDSKSLRTLLKRIVRNAE